MGCLLVVGQEVIIGQVNNQFLGLLAPNLSQKPPETLIRYAKFLEK